MAGAVRLVLDEGKPVGAVARDLDLTSSSLANWVRHAQADRTKGRTGLTTAEREELARSARVIRAWYGPFYRFLRRRPKSSSQAGLCEIESHSPWTAPHRGIGSHVYKQMTIFNRELKALGGECLQLHVHPSSRVIWSAVEYS